MEALMSNWPNPVQSMPEKYIFPPHKRPGTHVFPVIDNIPVIDLGNPNRAEIIKQILQASQEFGFFQVINHGIDVRLMDDTMNVMREFFETPPDYKARFYSTEMSNKCRIYSSTMNYDREEVHYWRDNFTHHCHPLEDNIHLWPDSPPRYRDVVGTYSMETRKLLMRILELVSEGLGLKPDYFENDLSKIQLMSVNHHIPCPDPSLTLGMPEHYDPNLITILHQCSAPGLQVLRHNQWMNVKPLTDTFIVIPGLQLKVMSNGVFSSPFHRVVAHSEEARTTIGMFLIPSMDVVIQSPAHHPVYRKFNYSEFFSRFTVSNLDSDTTLAFFKNNTGGVG